MDVARGTITVLMLAPLPNKYLLTPHSSLALLPLHAQVKDVDVARGTITVLTPAPGPLPNKYLLTGSLRSAMD